MGIFEPVPKPTKCECWDPHCLGWFADNIEIREGRFKAEDVRLVLQRKNLAKLPKLFIAFIRKYGLDHLEKELYTELTRLQGEVER